MSKTLSVIIPAKSEQYLQQTINSIFEKAETDLEVIVALDSWKVDLKPHPRLKVLEFDNVGQRRATNLACLVSTSKYIMKCDAHVLFSKGFDTELLKAMDDRTIMSPYLLALDEKNWKPIPQPATSSYCFDPDLIFHFNREAETDEMIEKTMCLQGCAFIVSRENYWRWDLCDESLGSWGGQGIELGIKAYLNGGRCVTNKNCFVAHLFRKEFPYKRDMKAIKKTLDAVTKKLKTKKIAGLIRRFNYSCGWDETLVHNLE